MNLIIIATLAIMAVLLSMGVWVGVALTGVGILTLELFRHMPVEKLLAQTVSNVSMSPELVALPLFILMGEILFRTKLSKLLFDGLSPWTRHIPGRLLHTNVLGCTLFAAISGSSAATTATVGRITFKELTSRGYDPRIAAGSLAGAGTLGFLIPPSTLMIVYGVLAQVSVLKMFMAGIIPGLLLALAFMIYVAIYALLNPARLPKDKTRTTLHELIMGLLQLGPVVSLIGFVVGSMMLGFATPTEAAAMGVLGALLICVLQRCFTWRGLWEALMGAMQTSSMIGLIIVGAVFLSVAMGYLKVPATIAGAIGGLGLSPFALIMLLIAFYVILGAVLEGMSIIVMSLPITLPLITAAGYDPIWFGVFLILVVEMAQVTPPVGFNLFVLNGLSGMSLSALARAALPFFLILVAFTVLITVFPDIVLYLPRTLEH
ncbi:MULTISPECIES: TRAP transporter large permease [unclassified Pseudomonas]|uniref:TRAP transporter large permease n=1 Tax=unclassified Pseudomonas TaxID=196821 RepID=UPI00131E3D26|nr:MULTISPECIES: TRAP transporter large permease subunit [unclassified Pseudomonas]